LLKQVQQWGIISSDNLADKYKSDDVPGLCSDEGHVLVTSLKRVDAVAKGDTSLQPLTPLLLYVGRCWTITARDGAGGGGEKAGTLNFDKHIADVGKHSERPYHYSTVMYLNFKEWTNERPKKKETRGKGLDRLVNGYIYIYIYIYKRPE
jgi:hypothetical protein